MQCNVINYEATNIFFFFSLFIYDKLQAKSNHKFTRRQNTVEIITSIIC